MTGGRRPAGILLLGGSQQQVIAIETAKRLGYRTVLCDYLPDNPGRRYADVSYLESTTDRERVLQVARREGVSGVLAYASDPAAPTAAYVAERLGLPTNPLASVETLSEKHLFRDFLVRHGFPCPRVRVVGADVSAARLLAVADALSYPLMLKPTDSSGSKGVTRVDEPDVAMFERALAHAREFSRNGTLVLEEYIRAGFPRVIGGDVFVVRGWVTFWGLMSCLRDEALGGLVPVGERYPSGLTGAQEDAVRQQVQHLVSELGMRFGELNVEMIIDEDGTPHFLELGARAGGNMIPVQLSDISGIDLVEANVRFAMGGTMDVDFGGGKTVTCSYVLHAPRDGLLDGVDVAPELLPQVYRTVAYVRPGGRVGRFDGADKAVGIMFLRFGSVGQMEDALDRMGELVRVRVS